MPSIREESTGAAWTRALEIAEKLGDASEDVLSLCNALVQAACPVALFVGDLAAAERYIAMLLDYSAKHGLALWHVRGRGFNGMLLNKTGDAAVGLQLLGTALGYHRILVTA